MMGYTMHSVEGNAPTKEKCPHGLLIWYESKFATIDWYKVYLTNEDTHFFGEVSVPVCEVNWWTELPPHPDEFKNGGS